MAKDAIQLPRIKTWRLPYRKIPFDFRRNNTAAGDGIGKQQNCPFSCIFFYNKPGGHYGGKDREYYHAYDICDSDKAAVGHKHIKACFRPV